MSAGWYVVALGHSSVIFAVGMAAYAVAAHVAGVDAGRLFYPPASAQRIAAMLLIPLTEQIPWRGFAFPRLRQRYGPLKASLILGATWALFHVQKHLFLDGGIRFDLAALTILFMTAGTVVFTWMYERTRGSLLIVVVANMGAYLNNSTDALPGNLTPFVVHTAAYCVMAAVVVFADRRVLIP